MWGQTKQHSGLPGWRLDSGLTTLSCKKFMFTETKSVNDTTQTGKTAVEAQMILLSPSRREAQHLIGPIVGPRKTRQRQDKTLFIYTTHRTKKLKKTTLTFMYEV